MGVTIYQVGLAFWGQPSMLKLNVIVCKTCVRVVQRTSYAIGNCIAVVVLGLSIYLG